jgi:phosphate acetyltransferase
MMVRLGYAHGMVCGKYTSSFTVMAAVRALIPPEPGQFPSSLFLLEAPEGYTVFSVMGIADVVINTDPAAEELASIVVTSCETFQALTGLAARAAILSYSTGTSGSGPLVDRVHEAMAAYRRRGGRWMVFGPCQVDAALDPRVARNKKGCPFTEEPANLLIGPDLNVSNCIYKAFRKLVPDARSLLCSQGLSLPMDDLSRGDDVDDVVNVIAANVIKAQIVEERKGTTQVDTFFLTRGC